MPVFVPDYGWRGGLRKRYGLNLLAIGENEQFEINPDPYRRLYKGLAMVVIGSNRDIDRLPI